MNWLFSLYVAILFFILTPAILLRIPKNGNKYTVAGVHAIVFALLLHFTGKFVWNFSMSMEGFQEGAACVKQTQSDDGLTPINNGALDNQAKGNDTAQKCKNNAMEYCKNLLKDTAGKPVYEFDNRTKKCKAVSDKSADVIAALAAKAAQTPNATTLTPAQLTALQNAAKK
jgi:hypothetical protein